MLNFTCLAYYCLSILELVSDLILILLSCCAQHSDIDSRVSPYLKKELLRISDKEKVWREKLWRNGIVKSSRMPPRQCPQYVGTEEVQFILTYGPMEIEIIYLVISIFCNCVC